jgi:hypothetical protein
MPLNNNNKILITIRDAIDADILALGCIAMDAFQKAPQWGYCFPAAKIHREEHTRNIFEHYER